MLHTYVWQVSLQVTSPERPALRTQREYRVLALSNARDTAIATAKECADRDELTVIDVVGVCRGYKVPS